MDDGLPPNVVHEAEAQRQHPRVRIAGRVKLTRSGEHSHALIDLSAGGLAFTAEPGEQWKIGEMQRGQLSFNVAPVVFALPVTLQVRNVGSDGRRIGCAFQELGPREIAVLRQLIGGTLAGELVSSGELITALSRDNYTKARQVKDAGAALSGGARMRALTMTALMFAVGLIAFFYAVGKIYAMAFVTRASAAKIAATSFNVTMPRDGTFFSLVPADGIVKKGQPLGSFQAAMLDVVPADLGSLKLSPEQLSELIGEQLKGTLSSPCDCRVQRQLAFDSQYVNRGQPLFELVPVDAQPYVVARFRFENVDKLPVGKTLVFNISGEGGDRYGKVRDVRLLTSTEAGGDSRGLPSASNVADIIVSIEPAQPLDAALIDRPVDVTLGSETAVSAAVSGLADRLRTAVESK